MFIISIISLSIILLLVPEFKNSYEDSKMNDWWTSVYCIDLDGEVIERFGYDECNSSMGIFRAEFGIPKEYIKELYINGEVYNEEHWHLLRLR